MELMKLPRVDSKLRVFSFKIQFRSQVRQLIPFLLLGSVYSFAWPFCYCIFAYFFTVSFSQVSDLKQNLNIVNSSAEEVNTVNLKFHVM